MRKKSDWNPERQIAHELQSSNIQMLERLDARSTMMNTIEKYLSACPEAFGSDESFTTHDIACYGDLLEASDEVLRDIVKSLQEDYSLADYADVN